MNNVREFHKKFGFPLDKVLEQEGSNVLIDAKDLEYTAEKLEVLVRCIKHPALESKKCGDERMYRIYLILGEVLEICRALAAKDEIELADGLGDLDYVTKGTAETYGLPFKEICDEVHKSNMTKALSDVKDDETRNNKTEQFVRPDMEEVIRLYNNPELICKFKQDCDGVVEILQTDRKDKEWYLRCRKCCHVSKLFETKQKAISHNKNNMSTPIK